MAEQTDDLAGKSAAELKGMLRQLGAKVPTGRASRETLRLAVIAARGNFEVDQSPSGVVGVPQGEAGFSEEASLGAPDVAQHKIEIAAPHKFGGCSEAEVLKATARHREQRGMSVTFAENCWTFKRGDRVDSGTLSQPVYSIVKCADAVIQDAIPASSLFKKNIPGAA